MHLKFKILVRLEFQKPTENDYDSHGYIDMADICEKVSTSYRFEKMILAQH